LWIPGWHPTPLNKLLRSHWGTAAKLKAKDRKIITTAARAYGVAPAPGRRKVSLFLVLGKGQRAADPDAFWKSTLDALVACGALKDDDRLHVELAPPAFARGDAPATFITLEDVP